jgi:hypothetical protein
MHDQLTLQAFRSTFQSVPSCPARPNSPVAQLCAAQEAHALRSANEEFTVHLAKGERW